MTAKTIALAAVAFSLSACTVADNASETALAGDWNVDAAASRVNFVSIKAGELVEAHHFTGVSGKVAADGMAQVTIDLASVETNIDIRNERMREMLFDVANFPDATVSAQIDTASFADLAIGQSAAQTLATTVSLHGAEVVVPADVIVTRVAENRVRVDSTGPLVVSAATFGLDTGLEQLREIAMLDSITGQVPVTFSLTFDKQAD